MRNLLLAALLCSLIGSCKKDENTETELQLNTFALADTIYTATEYGSYPYWGTNTGVRIYFAFRNPLKPAGKYRIAKVTDTDINAVTATFRYQMGGFGADYSTTGNDHKELTVSYDSGKMYVKMPKAWVFVGISDSMQVSAYLKEGL